MAKVIKCKICGDTEFIELENELLQCRSCKHKMEKPKDNADLLERANNLRYVSKDFDAASRLYEEIIRLTPDESEAYWGKTLCKYGIEYVKDHDGTYLPTCHRTLAGSILDDADYRLAAAKAKGDLKNYYTEQATLIDDYQKNIKLIAAKEEPYDVFISFKATDDNGRPTEDSLIAQELYYYLEKNLGLKTFFSNITLKDKAGKEFEPIIYAALNSATVMILVGTTPDYINATWVKNEWTRYIAMMSEAKKEGKSKYIISAIKGMRPEQLPSQLLTYQAVDYGELGAKEKICRNIDGLIGDLRVANQKQSSSSGVVDAGEVLAAKAKNLCNLGFQQLTLGNIGKADEYFDKALEENSETSLALWGKLLIDQDATGDEQLAQKAITLADYSLYRLALENATAEEKLRYETVAGRCAENLRRADAKTQHTTAYRGEIESQKYFWTKNYKEGEKNSIDAETDALFTKYSDANDEVESRYSEKRRIENKKSFSFGWVIMCVLVAVFAVVPSLAVHSFIGKVTDQMTAVVPNIDMDRVYADGLEFDNVLDSYADYEAYNLTAEEHELLMEEIGSFDTDTLLWEVILFLVPLYILCFALVIVILKLFLSTFIAIIGALVGGGYLVSLVAQWFINSALSETDWILIAGLGIFAFGILMFVLGIIKNRKLKAQLASAFSKHMAAKDVLKAAREKLIFRSVDVAKAINDKYYRLYGDEIDNYEPDYCIAQAIGIDDKELTDLLGKTVTSDTYTNADLDADDDIEEEYEEANSVPSIHAAAPGMMHVLLKSVKYPALTKSVLRKQLDLSYSDADALIAKVPVFVAVDIPEKKANKLKAKLEKENCVVELYQ